MLSEKRIASGLDAAMQTIEPPPVPLARIRELAAAFGRAPARGTKPFGVAAAAVVAMFLAIAVPLIGSGFVQSVEAQIESLLRWKPPPPAPPAIWSAMRQVPVTFPEARSRVSFALVAPAGVPDDVISQSIYIAPTGVFSTKTRTWSVGPSVVTFVYRRARGRSFSVTAERFDPTAGPPSKYMFEDMDRKQNGREVILRRDKITWRNGDQVMTAITGDGVDAAEIATMRNAMRGITVSGVWPRANRGVVKQYRMP